MLAAYDESGLTQAGFARREGIKYNTFTSWIYERRTRGTEGAACRAGAQPVRFAEVGLAGVAGRGPQVEAGALSVTLPDGLVVRGAEAAPLAALVKALRS